MSLELIWEFVKSFCILFFVAFVLSRMTVIKKHLTTKPSRLHEKVVLSLIFGMLGCVGSSIGVEFQGSLVNTRVIGVAIGGLIGGPSVGIASGLIAGLHRIFFVKSGMLTAVVCGTSMIIEGAFAGYASRYYDGETKLWPIATMTVIVCELFRKLMLLLFIRPLHLAVVLVENMTIPMLIINSLGVALFITFIESMAREQDALKGRQSQMVLTLAEKISTCFKQGLVGEQQHSVVVAIEENTDFSHVLLTGPNSVITSNLPLSPTTHADISLQLAALKKDLKDSNCISFNLDGLYFLATPIMDNKTLAGFLLLGKEQGAGLHEWKLAEGLGKLFSSQITIGNLEYRSNLLKEAEIKVLQTQINPHFLFNTLTVIASLCRTDPTKARSIINNLAEFYRKNLRVTARFVSLQDEIEHIEAYLEIVKARYKSKIDVCYDIDRGIDCYLPPLSLQPLVENSIKHGLLPCKKGGTISIRAKRESGSDSVRIEVEDNGRGFDTESPSTASDSNHVGLDNVRKRLESCFGDEVTWEVHSQPNSGTKVVIGIPNLAGH